MISDGCFALVCIVSSIACIFALWNLRQRAVIMRKLIAELEKQQAEKLPGKPDEGE